jgi:adenosine deaminase
MPKIELHAHVGGCFRPRTFLELVEEKGQDLENIDFYNVDMQVAFEFFKVGGKLVTDIKTLQRVVYEIIEDYSA